MRTFIKRECTAHIILSILRAFIPLLYLEYLLFSENCARFQSHGDFSDKVIKKIRGGRQEEKLGENEYIGTPALCKLFKRKKFWKRLHKGVDILRNMRIKL